MRPEYPRYKVLFLALVAEGAVLLAALLFARYFNIVFFRTTDYILRDMLIGTAGAALPFAFFIYSLSNKAGKFTFLNSARKIVLNDIKAVFAKTTLTDLVIISFVAGLAEEMLFRGVLQVRFGIVIASIAFGLVHCVSLSYVILTIIMGFYIGVIFNKSGSLIVPVQLHFIYDLAALAYLKYFIKERDMKGDFSR